MFISFKIKLFKKRIYKINWQNLQVFISFLKGDGNNFNRMIMQLPCAYYQTIRNIIPT